RGAPLLPRPPAGDLPQPAAGRVPRAAAALLRPAAVEHRAAAALTGGVGFGEARRVRSAALARASLVDLPPPRPYLPRPKRRDRQQDRDGTMKIVRSLKTLKSRHKDCRLIRRKGRMYVINKTNPRFKA